MDVIGNGIYDLTEASQLTGLTRARVRDWFRAKAGPGAGRSAFESDYQVIDKQYAISFLDLIEVFVAGHLREHGVAMRDLQKAHRELRLEWDTRHPFARREILADGKDLFLRLIERKASREALVDHEPVEKVIEPALNQIDYAPTTGLAQRWHMAPKVFIDPRYCFGRPIVEPSMITTWVLAQSYIGHKHDADSVARWFEIDVEDVWASINFEAKIAA